MIQLALAEISPLLTESALDRAFKLRTRSQDDVTSISVSRAAPAGTGLIGAVFRIKVFGNEHTASFIVKAMAQDPVLKRSLRPEKFFKREVYFFSEILPSLMENQKRCGAKETIQDYIPICYECHCDGINDFLLLEDLCESGYTAVSENPTKHESDAILKTLAHFHAVAMALKLRKPKEFAAITSDLSELYYTESNRSWYSAYLQNAIEIDLKALAQYEDPKTSIYYRKFFELVTCNPYGQLIQSVTDQSAFPTINHGDAWTPNFFCSKERAVAIDFQLTRRASPATDLAYLIVLSSTQNTYEKDAHASIKIYYDALTYYLKDMKIDSNDFFSREDLNRELKKYGKFGVLAAVTSLPLLISEKCDVLDNFEQKYGGVESIPLEELWRLRPLETEEEKMVVVNAVKVAVGIGFI